MGKEIIRFHCLYWPAMLHAAGLPVPSRIFAHGHLTKDGKKLSKSTGNVIDPEALVAQWGPDPVRYFLLREGSFGQDWDFTESAFVGRYNSDLANDLGNLGSRTLTMVRNYCGGTIPARPAPSTDASAGFEAVFQTGVESMAAEVFGKYEACDFAGALSLVWSWIGQLNQRIAQVEPWVLAKDPARRGELDAVLYRWLEALRIVTLMASPVIPRAAARIYKMMGLEWRAPGPADLRWGLLEPGTALGTIEPVFPRIEKETKVSDTPNPPAAPGPAAASVPAPADGLIDITEFGRVELKVAKIIAAEKIEGAKKLLKLQVDLGTEQRQIVAGIAEAYAPETLVGRTIAVVANLKPAKLRGVESQGMLLAASIGDKPVLCTFDQEVPPGTKIK
jgi:methionyl-tRNA synthetase